MKLTNSSLTDTASEVGILTVRDFMHVKIHDAIAGP